MTQWSVSATNDPFGSDVAARRCVLFAALAAYFPKRSYPPHCGRIPTLILDPVSQGSGLDVSAQRRRNVMKFVIAVGTTIAFVTAAAAADLPRPQPVPQQPPVIGKMPIGKGPIGKGPVGKGPVVARY
jgi:hypothetical protein